VKPESNFDYKGGLNCILEFNASPSMQAGVLLIQGKLLIKDTIISLDGIS